MSDPTNTTSNSRFRAIGIFVGVTVLLIGLGTGGLYFARQRSQQLVTANTVTTEVMPLDNQAKTKPEKKKKPQGSDNQGGNRNNTEQTPHERSRPNQSTDDSNAANDEELSHVPSTGPEDNIILLNAGLISVSTYLVTLKMGRRQAFPKL